MTESNKAIIEANIKCQLDGTYIAPVVLASSPGTGKTSFIKQLSKQMNLAVVNQSAGQLMPEILSGLPNFKSAPNMDKYSYLGTTDCESTRWSVPELIEQANELANQDDNSGVILLLDDLHEISMAISPYMLEFLLERKLGQYILDKRVAIVCTMNDSDEANFSGMSSAVRNRLAILKWDFDFDIVFKKSMQFYHFYISSFLKTHQQFAQEDESTGIEGFGTPRAYEFLSNTFISLGNDFVSKHVNSISNQYISNTATNALNKHITYMNNINFESKVRSQEMADINSMKPLDMILWAYIVNYIETIDDAQYLINLIDKNIEAHSFIGFIVGELYNKYLMQNSGSKLSIGLQSVLAKLLENDIDVSSQSKSNQEIYNSMQFVNKEKLYALAAEFM